MIVLTVVWQVLQASTIEMPTSTFCSYFFFFFTIPSYPTASLLFVTFVSIYPRRRNTSAKASLSPHEATLKRTIIGRYLSISLFVVVVLLIPNVSGMATCVCVNRYQKSSFHIHLFIAIRINSFHAAYSVHVSFDSSTCDTAANISTRLRAIAILQLSKQSCPKVCKEPNKGRRSPK